MGVISICFVIMLITFGPFSGRGYSREPFPGPCQPFSANQTALCSGLETLVHDHGVGTFCNKSQVSCRPNTTSPPSRNERFWGLCYCDSLCQEIGDCCVDYDTWYTPRLSNHKIKPQKESCQREPSNKEKQILGYMMVASCPSSWSNDETAHACMSTNYSADPATALPVVDMTTNVTYANIYCAMCHGKSRNLHLWSLRIVQKPRQPVSLQDIASADTIWEAVPAGEIIPKKCLVTPSEASAGPDTAIKQLCRSYANGIQILKNRDTHTQQIIFDDVKSPHCALLSNPNVFVNRTVRCLRVGRFPSRMPSMLFVFSIHGKNSNGFRESTLRMEVNCPINEVYDPFKGRCLPVHTDAKSNGANSSEQCRGPSFPLNEFVILSNDSVFLIPHLKLYKNGTYIVINQTLILCSANFSRSYTKIATPTGHVKKEAPAYPLALRIITYIGFSLSIISLLFLLVTYLLFAELRTYPGKKVMHLSCAMIAMQTVYFVSDPDVVSSAVCAVMGALLHYFILAVFLWMSVIAHNTRKSLSTMNVNPHNPVVIARQRKAYICYSVFVWGFPLVVVGICVALQFANVGNVGYGVQDGCQLSIPARTFAVAAPVSASLLFNIISVIASAVAIRQHSQVPISSDDLSGFWPISGYSSGIDSIFTSGVPSLPDDERRRITGNTLAANQSNRNLTLIVLKLTAVTGGTWILGFILAFYPTPYLEYPFVIINSCQGVLICLSFVFKKNVFNLYKQRFNPTTLPEPTAREDEQQQQQQSHSEDIRF